MSSNGGRSDSVTNMIVPVADVYDEYRVLVEGTEIVSEPSNSTALSANLLKRYRQTELLLSENNLGIRFLGYAPVFSETKLYLGKDSDWAVMNLCQDPLFQSNGNKMYAPLAVVEEVKAVVKAGIDFDAIVIAHEVQKGSLKQGERVPVELIAPPPSIKVQRRLNFIERTVAAWWKFIPKASVASVAVPAAAGAVTVVAGTALIAAGVKTLATSTVAAGNAMAAANVEVAKTVAAKKAAAEAAAIAESARRAAMSAGYDPALLGVQFDPQCTIDGKPIGIWYYITAWVWPEV